MKQTITIDTKILDTILSRLDSLSKDIRAIKTRLISDEPEYGSDAWWEWSDKKALEDVEAGRYTEITSKKELHAFLDELK